MEKKSTKSINKIRLICLLAVFVFSLIGVSNTNAQETVQLRRPISPNQPMWLVHIDTWNYADPQKIIDLIPEDIRPYVVMNISLSISHDTETSRFKVAEYGYEIAKSWVRTCAQNQMWAMIQIASGGYAQFSDSDLSVYHEFFQDYPNVIGFNYAEQFWGYDDSTDPLSPAWTDRIAHFADLLKLCNQYGGYLVVSWCGNQWSPSINPVAMLKRNPAFAEACLKYTENYILCEKYTQQSYQSDMESICLGSYLSGYSGNYGIRYDDTGWTNANGEHANFSLATGGAPHLEHIMLTGQTVIDAPELIWLQCFHELNAANTTDGYMERRWETFPQFDNFSIDLFRKIIDGTIRIPSRQEVIDRTKLVVVNDVNSGSSDQIYSSPETMFEGLYRMDNDGNYEDNKSFFKKTGRYPTVPTVFQLGDDMAQSFDVVVNKSAYSTRWSSVSNKVAEFNTMFEEEYTGDLYVGRHENGWVTYNPYKTGQMASANIPFKFNTSESIDLTYSQYTSGVMKEYADKVTLYLSNYDENDASLKTDELKIYGCTAEPTYSYVDRADHTASVLSNSWADDVFTLTVQHNGPLDITINCAGNATDRLTSYTTASIEAPDQPAVYTGPLQYEAECFDYKYISGITTSGYSSSIRNYTGQGYLRFGTNALASVRDTVTVIRSGDYQLLTKYLASAGDVTTIDLYVNGTKVATPNFTGTNSDSDWSVNAQKVTLNTGKNVIVFKANTSGTNNIVFDNIVVTQGEESNVYTFSGDIASTESSSPAAQLVTVQSGSAGVVAYTNANSETSNCFKAYTVGTTNSTAVADLDMFSSASSNYSIVWKEYYETTGGKKGVLLRGTGDNGSSAYAEGMKQGYLFIALNNDDNTVTLEPYVAGTDGLTSRATYTTSFTIEPGKPCWYRATVYDNQLKFECSNDSVTWVGGSETLFTDDTYSSGSTELVWGLNSNNFSWEMDNITYLSGNISVSLIKMEDFSYEQSAGPSETQSFIVSGNSLINNIEIQAPDNFEVSLVENSDFASTLNLASTNGEVEATTIYVRLKEGLAIHSYSGEIAVGSDFVSGYSISVEGEVVALPVTKYYDFSNDVVTTSAQTPPALDVTIGKNNTATAGVVSYTDTNGNTSNMLTPYSCGQRNSTGVMDLNLFSQESTDYSVTWKQTVGSDSYYKVGVLLRGDVNNVGSASTGYTQGIMEGYLLLVYTVGPDDRSEFRIYKSTSDNGLNMLKNGYVDLSPSLRQPVWYRASVSGSSNVELTLEYSIDNINWETGSSASDASSTAFQAGATQVVWGLAADNVDFYLDDITFKGFESANGTPDLINVSTTVLNGFSYDNDGMPYNQSFSVWGSSLTDDVYINAPTGYELTLDENQAYSSEINLSPQNGNLAETIVYVRLKTELSEGNYNGEVNISSIGVLTKTIALSGEVPNDVGIDDLPTASKIAISIEYYSLTGERINNVDNRTGFFIELKTYSDKTVSAKKILKINK
ncbi:glycoside hydrolase family 98 domain-containing protein [Plebeiibacterium marinum]|uniref:CBM6 domain-containing protein n=1 Tax=Plebeiibacterium marinum TaxID=2992111 RepID=A0AAE3MH49_9BACT|nr:glycoside hydrolase family 98 domain-containing protein [Plebeiobacterium marinum]MCW3806957.1 hypothetical protein [Plebeiobacterium marinum]